MGKISDAKKVYETAIFANRQWMAQRSKERLEMSRLLQSDSADDVAKGIAMQSMDSRWNSVELKAEQRIKNALREYHQTMSDKEDVRRALTMARDRFERLASFAGEYGELVALLDPLFRQTRGLLPGDGDNHIQQVLVMARSITQSPARLQDLERQLSEYGDDAPGSRAG